MLQDACRRADQSPHHLAAAPAAPAISPHPKNTEARRTIKGARNRVLARLAAHVKANVTSITLRATGGERSGARQSFGGVVQERGGEEDGPLKQPGARRGRGRWIVTNGEPSGGTWRDLVERCSVGWPT